MSISSILQMLSRADVDFADNNAGAITPAILRNFLRDFLETVSPAYAVIRCTSQVLNLTTTPQAVKPFTQDLTLTPDYFLNDLLLGSVTRDLDGVQGSRIVVNIHGSVGGAAGRDVVVELYRNGTATGYKQTVSCTGVANRNPFAFNAVDLVLSDATYDIRASAPVASAITFENIVLLVQAQPVRAFM